MRIIMTAYDADTVLSALVSNQLNACCLCWVVIVSCQLVISNVDKTTYSVLFINGKL